METLQVTRPRSTLDKLRQTWKLKHLHRANVFNSFQVHVRKYNEMELTFLLLHLPSRYRSQSSSLGRGRSSASPCAYTQLPGFMWQAPVVWYDKQYSVLYLSSFSLAGHSWLSQGSAWSATAYKYIHSHSRPRSYTRRGLVDEIRASDLILWYKIMPITIINRTNYKLKYALHAVIERETRTHYFISAHIT